MPDEKKVPNPFGRFGCPEHRNLIQQLFDFFKGIGKKVKYEKGVDLPNGSKRYADLAVLDDDEKVIEYHQVGINTKKGKPVKRERDAIDDIEGATGIKVEFHAYKTLILIVGLMMGGLLIYSFSSRHITKNKSYSDSSNQSISKNDTLQQFKTKVSNKSHK